MTRPHGEFMPRSMTQKVTATINSTSARKPSSAQGCPRDSKGRGILWIPYEPPASPPQLRKVMRMISAMPIVAMAR